MPSNNILNNNNNNSGTTKKITSSSIRTSPKRMHNFSGIVRLSGINTSASFMNNIASSIENLQYYEVIFQHEQELARIFLYYTSVLTKHTESSAMLELTNLKFLKFAKDCKLVDQTLTSNDLSLIFTEATKHSPTYKMNIDEFVCALCLIACRSLHPASFDSGNTISLYSVADMIKYHSLVSNYLDTLLNNNILPYAKRIILSPTPNILSSSNVIATMSRYEDSLYKVFKYYCTYHQNKRERDSWNAYHRSLLTLNVDEFYAFLKEFDIFPQIISKNVASSIFYSCCKGNYILKGIIDILKSGKSMSIDFWEFLDCLGRIALLRFCEPPFCNIYPTPESKIEALIEHLSMSNGIKRFVVEGGGKLFSNLPSPSLSTMYKDKIQQQTIYQSPTNRYSRLYQSNSLKSSQIFQKEPKVKFNTSIPSCGSPEASASTPKKVYFSKMELSPNISVENSMKEQEELKRVDCYQDNCILFKYNSGKYSWRKIGIGACALRDFPVINYECLEMQFTNDENNMTWTGDISMQNLPYIEEAGASFDAKDKLMIVHVWRRGSGHVFHPDVAYAIGFPNRSASLPFELAYERIQSFYKERQQYGTDYNSKRNNIQNGLHVIEVDQDEEIRRVDINIANASTPSKHSPKIKGTRIIVNNNSLIEQPMTVHNGSRILTASMLNTPIAPITPQNHSSIKQQLTPKSMRKQCEKESFEADESILDYFVDHTIQRNEHVNIEEYENIATKLITDYMDRYLQMVKACKQIETVHDQILKSSSPTKPDSVLNTIMNLATDSKTAPYIHLDSNIINNGNSGLQYLISRNGDRILDGVLRRIRLSSALYRMSKVNNSSFSALEKDRIQELLSEYLALEPIFLQNILTLKSYYDTLLNCLIALDYDNHHRTKVVTDILCKDSLGENMYWYQNGFFVVSKEQCLLEIHIIGHLFRFDQLSAIKSCYVFLNGILLLSQEYTASQVKVMYDEEKGTMVISIPCKVFEFERMDAAETTLESSHFITSVQQQQEENNYHYKKHSTNNNKNFDPQSPQSDDEGIHKNGSIILELVFQLSIEGNDAQKTGNIERETKKVKIKREIPLHVFPNQSALDRIRGKLRERAGLIAQELPMLLKPLKIFCLRNVSDANIE